MSASRLTMEIYKHYIITSTTVLTVLQHSGRFEARRNGRIGQILWINWPQDILNYSESTRLTPSFKRSEIHYLCFRMMIYMYIQYLLFSFSIYAHFYFFPFKATTSKMLHDKYKNTLNVQCNVLIWTILFDLLYFLHGSQNEARNTWKRFSIFWTRSPLTPLIE